MSRERERTRILSRNKLCCNKDMSGHKTYTKSRAQRELDIITRAQRELEFNSFLTSGRVMMYDHVTMSRCNLL